MTDPDKIAQRQNRIIGIRVGLITALVVVAAISTIIGTIILVAVLASILSSWIGPVPAALACIGIGGTLLAYSAWPWRNAE